MPYEHTRYKENIHTSIFVYTYSTYTHTSWITMVWGFSVQVRSFSWMWDSAIPRHLVQDRLIGWFAGDWWQYLANRARDLGWCQWWHIEFLFSVAIHQAGFFRCLKVTFQEHPGYRNSVLQWFGRIHWTIKAISPWRRAFVQLHPLDAKGAEDFHGMSMRTLNCLAF